MQLPIDLKELLNAVTDIQAARETSLTLSVYIDDTAPADLSAHVRGVFASTLPSVRMTISYLDSSFVPDISDDIAVLVAGESAVIGAAAAAMRAAGVPTMVVTTSPEAVGERAQASGHAIPEGDLVFPSEFGVEAQEPIALDNDAIEALDDRMGAWIVSVCKDKRLAFAIAFPFMRRSLAVDAIKATALQNAGIGAIPFVPGADLPLMTLNQAKMALQIAAAYGHEMDKDRLKDLVAVVGGAYVSRALARELTEFVPFLGVVIRPGIAFGATSALGYAIIEYYEGGENITGVANVASRASQAGAKFVSKVRAIKDNPASIVGMIPVESLAEVRDILKDQIPKIVDSATEIASKAVSGK